MRNSTDVFKLDLSLSLIQVNKIENPTPNIFFNNNNLQKSFFWFYFCLIGFNLWYYIYLVFKSILKYQVSLEYLARHLLAVHF